ncbi:MAG: phytanoyl-CoA dioxygenase family protein [Halioglobus sp.]
MATLPRISVNTDVTDVVAALDEFGGVIVENLLSPDLLAHMNDALDPHVETASMKTEINELIDAFFGESVRHVSGLAGKSHRFAEEVMCHPLFLGLCDRLLLPSCASYQLNLAHLMDRGPGSEQQMIHRDQDVWAHYVNQRKSAGDAAQNEIQVATIIALVDFTKENGATCLVPGSHRWPYDREPTDEELAYAEMPAGSAVIYRGSTLHAGGGNSTSNQWRRGVHMSYCLGWFRTEENNVLAVPPSVAKKLSLRAQELLGYGIHDAIHEAGGYLGAVNMRHPTKLLEEGEL